MEKKKKNIRAWLDGVCSEEAHKISMLPFDASARRYFRLHFADNTKIVMDASEDGESIHNFLEVDHLYTHAGLCVPEIYAYDEAQGLILMGDFGDTTYLDVLGEHNVGDLYQQALVDLSVIHRIPLSKTPSEKTLDASMLHAELEDFQAWFLDAHLKLCMSAEEQKQLTGHFERIIDITQEQPQVCTHRDYHSRNLMLLHNKRVGILDFQDTLPGPVTYDVVSLLKDCYIDWPEDKVVKWALFYYQQALDVGLLHSGVTQTQYLKWFDVMGMQRHLKAIYIFARKYHRDHDASYLKDISRALRYLYDTSGRYSEFMTFQPFIAQYRQKFDEIQSN